MILRLLKHNNPLRIRQIAQNQLQSHLNQLGNGAATIPQSSLSLFTLSFFSAPPRFRHESQEPLLDFFHTYGFTDTQIKNRLHKSPAIRSPKTMKPKLDHLLAFGFSPSELVRTIFRHPTILSVSLKERIEPNLKILEATIGSKTQTVKAIICGPRLLTHNLEKSVIPSINMLRENNIPTISINRLFTTFPRVLVKDPNIIIETISKLKGMGMSPSTVAFIQGMNLMAMYKKETWERKVELYQSLGWSEKDILSAFSRQPNYLAISDDKIKEKMKFFKEKLQWDSAFLAKQPVLLLYSPEGRIIPRCAVLNVLAKRKLWEGKPNLYGLFVMGEKKFKERFVDKHEKEVPQVIDAYQGKVEFTGFNPSIVLNLSKACVGV